jgi:hypothetical protein
VPLLAVMQLRRAYLPDPLGPEAARELETAKQRCLVCGVKKLCYEALEAGDANAFSLFCANTHYIQRVRSGRA